MFSGMADGSWNDCCASALPAEARSGAVPRPLIQIKQRRTGVHTLQRQACGRSADRLSGERVERSDFIRWPRIICRSIIAARSGTDVLMVVMGIFLVVTVLWVGTLYLRAAQPARTDGAQVAEAAVRDRRRARPDLAVHPHAHLFWIAGLLLAMIDLPDFGTPLRSIAEFGREDRGRHAGGDGERHRSDREADGASESGREAGRRQEEGARPCLS